MLDTLNYGYYVVIKEGDQITRLDPTKYEFDALGILREKTNDPQEEDDP